MDPMYTSLQAEYVLMAAAIPHTPCSQHTDGAERAHHPTTLAPALPRLWELLS